MEVAWKQKLAERQTEISQKSINKLVNWLEDYYSTFLEATIKRFLKVYSEMLSTLGEKQKSAPTDLYKLDSYWALQRDARTVLQIAGEDIYSQLNTQLKIMYVDIYEGIAPVGNESPCLVSEERIEELINLPWGADPKSTQEKVWLYMTILWDKLFGELMHCTIKNLPIDKLEKRLQDQFKSNKKSLDTLFSDSITHIQGYAAMRRYNDDQASFKGEFSYLEPYIETYGNEEEKEAYSVLATAFSARGLGDGDLDGDGDDEDFGDDDGDGEVDYDSGISEHLNKWSFNVELDFETCNACRDLSTIQWREYIFGPPPLPVHNNCRCTAVPYDQHLSVFGREAHNVADAVFKLGGGGLKGLALGGLVGAAMITLGVIMGDDYSGGSYNEESWLNKWGNKFHIDNHYSENNPWLVEQYGLKAWKMINELEGKGIMSALLGL